VLELRRRNDRIRRLRTQMLQLRYDKRLLRPLNISDSRIISLATVTQATHRLIITALPHTLLEQLKTTLYPSDTLAHSTLNSPTQKLYKTVEKSTRPRKLVKKSKLLLFKRISYPALLVVDFLHLDDVIGFFTADTVVRNKKDLGELLDRVVDHFK
jgi:hypothetical protein